MKKFFKIPDHWRSTEWQNTQYLKDTAQAKMFSERQARGDKSTPELLPEEPVADYEESAPRRYALQKKLGAGVLAVATLFAPNAQYGAAHEQAPHAEADTTSSEVCYDRVTSAPATTATETFVLSGAYNDPLSEAGEQTTLAQFEQSTALQDLQEYVQSLPEDTEIATIEVHGTASDDNRSNVEAGIGRTDEINQRTAASYASIATRAIKKLLGGRLSEAQLTQSAEEHLLGAEEQRAFEAVRQDAGMSSNADLLTAYNDVTSALDEQNRQALDSLISQHRGVEITIHTATPEQAVTTTDCEPATDLPFATPAAAEQPSEPLPPYNPAAILPTWSRVTRQTSRAHKKASSNPYDRTLAERAKWRAAVIADSLKSDWDEFKDTMKFISHGVANTGRDMSGEATDSFRDTYARWTARDLDGRRVSHTANYYPANYHPTPMTRRERLLQPIGGAVSAIKNQVQHLETAAPAQAKRLMRQPKYLAQDSTEAISRRLDDLHTRQQKLNHVAQIPTSDLNTLDPQEFHQKHGMFRDEYYETTSKRRSLPLRRVALQFVSKFKK